jgi:hypothetical protein
MPLEFDFDDLLAKGQMASGQHSGDSKADAGEDLGAKDQPDLPAEQVQLNPERWADAGDEWLARIAVHLRAIDSKALADFQAELTADQVDALQSTDAGDEWLARLVAHMRAIDCKTPADSQADRSETSPPAGSLPATRALRKNIYVKAPDRAIWDAAETLAGDSLSSLLTELLAEYVSRRRLEAEGWERIVVDVSERPSQPPKRAFWGRWVVPPADEFNSDNWCWALAQTRKNRIAIWRFDVTYSDDHYVSGHDLSVFDSIEVAEREAWIPQSLLHLAAERLGRVEVEELDI